VSSLPTSIPDPRLTAQHHFDAEILKNLSLSLSPYAEVSLSLLLLASVKLAKSNNIEPYELASLITMAYSHA